MILDHMWLFLPKRDIEKSCTTRAVDRKNNESTLMQIHFRTNVLILELNLNIHTKKIIMILVCSRRQETLNLLACPDSSKDTKNIYIELKK